MEKQHFLSEKEFQQQFLADKIYLVFSSYYGQSAASLYGHTFLRLARPISHPEDPRYELLDWGISYGAAADTTQALLYSWKGLTGGFKGYFQALPFYYQVRDYNDYESRDLWSYEILMNNDQKNKFLALLYQWSQKEFSYYYLTQNCSKMLVDLLAEVFPEKKKKINQLLPFYIIPSDTVRVLSQVGILNDRPTYRPSIKKRWRNRYKYLTTEQKIKFKEVLDSKDVNAVLKSHQPGDENLADTLLEFWDYKYAHEILLEPGVHNLATTQKNQLLLWRSHLPLAQPEQQEKMLNDIPFDEAPHLIHPARRVSVGHLHNSASESFTTLSYRFAYHDHLDPPHGANRNIQLEMMDLEIKSAWGKHQLSLEKLTLVSIASWNSANQFDWPLSYELDVGVKSLPRFESQTWHSFPFEQLSLGLTHEIQQLIAGVMIQERILYDEKEKSSLSLWGGVKTFLQLNQSSWATSLEIGELVPVVAKKSNDWLYGSWSFSYWYNTQWSLRLNYELEHSEARQKFDLNYYF